MYESVHSLGFFTPKWCWWITGYKWIYWYRLFQMCFETHMTSCHCWNTISSSWQNIRTRNFFLFVLVFKFLANRTLQIFFFYKSNIWSNLIHQVEWEICIVVFQCLRPFHMFFALNYYLEEFFWWCLTILWWRTVFITVLTVGTII